MIHVMRYCILNTQKSSARGGSTTSLTSATAGRPSASPGKVTKQQFNDFCEGEDDPMLSFLAQQLQVAQAQANSLASQTLIPTKLDVIYQNTYRTEPSYKFFPDLVSTIISNCLSQKLDGVAYCSKSCAQLASQLSAQIKVKVKSELFLPRHKLVAFVTIGEIKDQGVFVGSRGVWSPKFDGFASSSFKNETLFAVGILYAVYLE